MVRGKYLRERKAIRVKRRIRFIAMILILLTAYKIVFNSYSLYESQAVSTADVDVAFFLIKDEYQKENLQLENMVPGDKREVTFTLSNYFTQRDPETDEIIDTIVTETDMMYTMKIRSTTNLPLTYKIYVDGTLKKTIVEGIDVSDDSSVAVKDAHDTWFYTLYDEEVDIEVLHNVTMMHTYKIEVEFPDDADIEHEVKYRDVKYENIIEAIEISIDGRQIID